MRTSWAEVRKFYGLLPPFNFRIAVPFLLSLGLLGVIFLVCAFLSLRGELNFGTARFYFFLYLGLLLVVGAVFSKAGKLPYVILVWCVVELGLGLGSNMVPQPKGRHSLFPENVPVDTSVRQDIYHPLLQSVLRPNYSFTFHLDYTGQLDTAKAAGIDAVSLEKQEIRIVQNSMGLRGKELTAADLAKDLIFAYGGSTTNDGGVTQGGTWVERLQSDLGNKYTILNWGAGGYSTVESLLQTAFYQDMAGKEPVCAIYYLGWNDIDEAHIAHLDGGYADFHILRMAVTRDPLFLAKFSPILTLANALAVRRFDTIPLAPEFLGQSPVAGRDERLEAVFTEHIKAIAAINAARGVKTIFIPQIYNRSWPADAPEKFLPLVRGQDMPLLAGRFKSILKDTAPAIGAKYIDPGNSNFEGRDFVDSVHFAARGSSKFAALVSKQIGDYCR